MRTLLRASDNARSPASRAPIVLAVRRRENCVAHPFQPGKESRRCGNCYCYCCDDHASKCPQWPEHCVATHTLAKWRDARQAWRDAAARKALATSSAAASAPSTSTAVVVAAAEPTLGTDEMLKLLEQVTAARQNPTCADPAALTADCVYAPGLPRGGGGAAGPAPDRAAPPVPEAEPGVHARHGADEVGHRHGR